MKKTIFTFLFVSLFSCTLMSQTWTQYIPGVATWSLAKDFQGNLFAGTTTKAIYKSTDGGSSWNAVFSGGVSNILSIACDSANSIYAAYGSTGLLKSTNGGANWTTIALFGGKTVQSVVCGKNGYIYVGAVSGGFFRSTDYGSTFPDTALSGLTIVILTLDRFNSGFIYAGVSSASASNTGFYRSTDAGLTFSANLNPYNIWGIVQKLNTNLYTVTTTTGYPVSKSTDRGLNWANISVLPGAMRGACLDLNENIYASGNGGVFKSTNDGVTFANYNLTISSNQSICYQNKIIVAASGTTNGGIWICTDSTLSNISGNVKVPNKYYLSQNYPNPFNPTTKIKYQIYSSAGNRELVVKLTVYDISGKEIKVLVNERQPPGTYAVMFDGNNLTSGVYFYKLVAGDFESVKSMVLIK
jgi:photosystem II stability/assembly factor-like uncharacterized protein